MKTHIMLDMETLGKHSHAVIIQIGLVAFNKENDHISSFKKSITLDSNLAIGNQIDQEVFSWWLKTDPNKLNSILEQGEDIERVVTDMLIWLRGLHHGHANIKEFQWWSKPSVFDMPKLRSSLRRLGMDDPIPFRGENCVRTISKAAPDVYKNAGGNPTHDAVDDCIAQIKGIKAVCDHLNITDTIL